MTDQLDKKPLRVFLCDLTHDTIILVSDTIPINIGFIAAYIKKILGAQVDISLFKYPNTVIQAIKNDPPDVIALSNYSWNSNLSEHVAGIAKKMNPHMITVQGGTNFPHKDEHQLKFMMRRPNTDFFVEYEGEIAMTNLLSRILLDRIGEKALYSEPIPSCLTILPKTRNTYYPQLMRGQRPNRIRPLDNIPSPYLTGLLDPFFDGHLTPFLETNRGCPFTCTFCHTGNDYFNRVDQFPIERIIEEIHYIGPFMKKSGIKNLHIADTNFGMYARDKEICEALKEAQGKYGWPVQIMATTGKNKKEQVIELTQILGNAFSVNMSVQSMDPTVLKNIKRDNIKLDHYLEINKNLSARGRSTKGEVIVGLPGETKESFVRGVEQMLEAGVSLICSYSLMLLHGTMFQDPEYRIKFGIEGKYRIVPLNFGNYDGTRIFDTEETGIKNKDMSFEDYLWIRGLALLVEVLHNSQPFNEMFRFANGFGISIFNFIMKAYTLLDRAPSGVQEIFQGFMEETEGELWDREEDLIAHYRRDENYQRLVQGEIGGNVIYKYKAMSLAFQSEDWVNFLGEICQEIVKENFPSEEEKQKMAFQQIEVLKIFVKNKLAGVMNAQGDVSKRSMVASFDFVRWLKSPEGTLLSDFSVDRPMCYEFEYTEEQLATRDDQFKRYGTDANALSKIVTRVSNVESLFRKIRVDAQGILENENSTQDQFVRYSLSS